MAVSEISAMKADRPRYDPASLAARAKGRVSQLPRRLDVDPSALSGARILEVGCGNGECTAAAIEIFGADAFGVDVVPRWMGGPYAALRDEGRLRVIDACHPYEMRKLGSFDFAHSYVVFEHIPDPFRALRNVHDALKPGGTAFLSFNLYLGASASHLAGYLPDLPWVHLTHTEEEARAIMKARHGVDRGFSWVNKWTDQDYLDAAQTIGFEVKGRWFQRRAPEPEFYEANRETLGGHSAGDLSKNFMNLRLRRPVSAP